MAGLVGLGFLVRTTNAPEVFVGGGVVFPGNDPYFQAHRVFQALASYPWLPLTDPLLDHPHGAAPIWPPLFPWLLASLARLFGLSAENPVAVERLLALSTPVLGALVCVPVHGLGRRILDGPGAWLAATFAVLIPAHLWYSRLGFVDHHAAVTLVQVAMFLGALVAVQEERRFGLTAALVVGLYLWNGYVLFVGILDLYLLALLFLEDTEGRRRIGRTAAWSHGIAAIAVVPLAIATVRATGLPWGTFAFSFLHVAALTFVAGAALGVALAPERTFGWLSGIALLAVVVGFGSGAAGDVAGWVFARDDFMASVQEAVPIFRRSDGTLDLAGPTLWLTRFWFLVPILLPLLLARSFRGGRVDAGRLLIVVWGTALFLLALRQRRLAETFAPALAILVAWGLGELQGRARAALDAFGWERPWARRAAAGLVAVVFLYGLGPYYGPLLRDPGGFVAIAQAAQTMPAAPVRSSSHEALQRLARIARADGDRATHGVMNLWPLGHQIIYLTRLPVVVSPFGSHVGRDAFDEATTFFLETDETSAASRLDSRRVRYVVVDNDLGTIGASLLARGESPRQYYEKTPLEGGQERIAYQPALFHTLYLRLALLAGAGHPELGVRPLHHFRLLVDAARDHHPGHPKIYERVRGARLRLTGEPETDYTIRYAFRSDAGRDRVLSLTLRTDRVGVGEVRLPYSSERPELGQDAPWQVLLRGGSRAVHVTERSVHRGEIVAVDVS